MIPRADRIAHIRELLEDRRHPERRVGLFSATNLTRLAIRFLAMVAASGLVHALVGGTILELPLAAVAVGATDLATTRLWSRIGEAVRRGWTALGLIVAVLMVIALVAGQVTPDSALTRVVKEGATGFIDAQNAKLDAKGRGRRVPIDPAKASGDQWELLVSDGALVRGTLEEARTWCGALGPGWSLPPGLGGWPVLATYPDVGSTFYVWTGFGGGIQIGDGKAPAVATSGSRRPTETRAVLCLKAAS